MNKHSDNEAIKHLNTNHQSDAIDEASDESFPASDPPTWNPVTGVGAPEHDSDHTAHRQSFSSEQTARQAQVSRQTQEEYDVLRAAMNRLEAALASAAPGRAQQWTIRVHSDLQAVQQLLIAHIDSTDKSDGLFAELDLAWPTLSRKTEALREQHQNLVLQTRSLLLLTEKNQRSESADFAEIRRRAERLLAALRQHQAAETDLIFESFYTDIGVGD